MILGSDQTYIKKISDENGYTDLVFFPEGQDYDNAAIRSFAFTWGILGDLDSCGYANRWCYHTYARAREALEAWALTGGVGEPQGWHRELAHGRRRPDGDASREYINW